MVRSSETKHKQQEISFLELNFSLMMLECQKQEKDIKLRVVSNIHSILRIVLGSWDTAQF